MNAPMERCCVCDDPTGRAGRGDDSLYTADGTGPYCEECFPGQEGAPDAPEEER